MNQDDYKHYYSEKSFKQKLHRFAKTAGIQVAYSALLLFYLMKEPTVPLKAKVTIAAALGYFIFPIDAIPDILPLIGFGDDLGVLIFALSQISGNITPEIQEKAKNQLHIWFKQVDEDLINEINSKIL